MSERSHVGYHHQTPGRLRVRVTNLKNRVEAAKSLQVLLCSQSGVKRVSANPVTANVLISYDPKLLSYEDIMESLADLGHLPVLSKQEVETENYDLSGFGMSLAKICLKSALKGTPAGVILELF